MMIRYRPLLKALGLFLTLVVFSVPIFSQQGKESVYENLLEKVKRSDPDVDFTALRFAYADNPPKDSGPTDPDAKRNMFAAFGNKDYGKAIENAQKILKGNFVDINAHLILAASYKEKKEVEKQKFHGYVAEGLVKSILNSGDGKSQEQAFVVISVDEEYVILRVLGLIRGLQSLENVNGHHYDRLEATDPKTKQKVTLYFNIDRPYGELEKIFK